MRRNDPEGEGDFDLLREDGWLFEDILDHTYLDDEGNYLGPKPLPLRLAVAPPLPMASTKAMPKKRTS